MQIAGEDLDVAETHVLGDLIEGAAVRICGRGIEAAVQSTPDGGRVAGFGRIEDAPAFVALAGDLFDAGLHVPPAFEAMLARNEKLRVEELCGGVGGSEVDQAVFRGLAKPVEIGASRESLRHGTPSFLGAR